MLLPQKTIQTWGRSPITAGQLFGRQLWLFHHANPIALLGHARHQRGAVYCFIFLMIVISILCSARMAMGFQESAIGTSETTICESVPPSLGNGLSEVFEISSRHLPDRFRSIHFECPNLEFNHWQGGRWIRSSADEVLPTQGTGVLTILYVHGNFMERNNALERVRILDSYLKQQADRPYRLMMLSWPSQRESKPLRDVFANAESAECQSLYVAWVLRRLRSEQQVSVLGFSFGARSVTGGLHLDAGGQLPGYAAIPRDESLSSGVFPSYRIGLVAPAIDRNWIESNGRHGLALQHADSLLNLYNSKDPILRRFRFLDRLASPIAAGFAGFEPAANPRATQPLTGQTKIRQFDCGSVIGTTHAEKSYYGECPYFRTKMVQHLLWKDAGDLNSNGCVVPQ